MTLCKDATVAMKWLFMLLNTCTLKIKINTKTFYIFKNGTKTPKMANLYSRKDLFIRHPLWWEKPKTCSERQHVANGPFIKVSYMMNTSPRLSSYTSLTACLAKTKF